jgi:hypothetical protein
MSDNPHPIAEYVAALQHMGDPYKPHRLPDSCIGPDAPGEELLGWECKLCGEWVSEYRFPTPCHAHLTSNDFGNGGMSQPGSSSDGAQ